MAKLYGAYTSARNILVNNPIAQVDGSVQGGHVRVDREKVTLAGQTTADTIVVAYPSKGESFLFGVLTSTVSLGTSTIAIGTAAAPGKYRAAATFTAALTPTLFGAALTDLSGFDKLPADEETIITITTAALPGSGTLFVDLYFAQT